MSRRNATALEFDAIAIEGGLLPAEWLGKVAVLESGQQKETDYGTPKGLSLRDELARFWRVAEAHWSEFAVARNTAPDAQALTSRFVISLLREVFACVDVAPATTPCVIDERSYPLSATGLQGRLPLVIAAHTRRLDERDRRYGDTGRQRSAFGLLQDYLNAADDALWGIASNGLVLRLARDNASLTRPAWIEADLERIFTEQRFADFSLLWLLIHASRFGPPGQPLHQCPLEAWRDASREEGTRAREALRIGVEVALAELGQGFLVQPGNEPLRQRLAVGELTPTAYFQQLLRLVYRLIFLLTIEERALLHPPGSEREAIELYHAGYSLQRLRARARRRRAYDSHADLWVGLRPVFAGLAAGQPVLALPALGGLFASDQCPDLDEASLGNRALLAAVYKLAWMHSDGSLVRINWRDMGPEELGSVYESLLELVPQITADGRHFTFAGANQSKGNARKTSGSYYTPDSLVQELLDSALEPVIAQRTQGATDPQQALLTITVCDPACGSGHFLLAAARRLANHLARMRAQGTPSGEDYRHALRDVIGNCIFGVDLNPMALELTRMSLWLEAMTPDRPLGFLDHHLQCGDALLGVLDPAILDGGLPDDAFAALTGDDKKVASTAKKQNKTERESWQQSLSTGDLFRAEQLAATTRAIEQLADDDLAGVAAKRAAWLAAQQGAHASRFARLADLFVGAFLLPKAQGASGTLPSSRHLWAVANNHDDPMLDVVEQAAQQACAQARVLHWWVAFPQIAAAGGFSIMLGNPPWERIKLQEEEYFSARSPLIATALNKAERGKRIAWLRQGHLQHMIDGDDVSKLPPSSNEQAQFAEFERAKRVADATSAFVHTAGVSGVGRYPLTGVGDVNLYALFAETFLQLSSTAGRAGLIIPSGIATDDTTKHFFAHISDGRLVRLHDLRTGPGLFSEIGHQRYKFCLLTLGRAESAEFLFFALSVQELKDELRSFTLTPAEFALINPNTRTCPVFRSQRDAALTKELYRRAPVLIREAHRDAQGNEVAAQNPWGITFQTMFHMSNDSGLFKTHPRALEGRALPLYEAKLIHQFDHRWATYADSPRSKGGVDTANVTSSDKLDPAFTVRPHYWVDEREVLARIARVPPSTRKAWLEVHQAGGGQVDGARRDLWLALAQWVAGEVFRQEAGPPSDGAAFSNGQRLQATPRAERILSAMYPTCANALREAGISSRKALVEFAKWATQTADVPLAEHELSVLAHVGAQPATDAREQALLMELDVWMDRRTPRWLMGWRDICRSTDERTVIASVMPRAGVNHKTPLWVASTAPSDRHVAALLGNFDALVLDYVARQKLGGTSLTYFYMKQFPFLSPDSYSAADLSYIVPRVLELTYTAHDLAPWAEDLGHTGPPFAWDPVRRAELRAELDAYYAKLYGLNRDELRYILEPSDVMGEDYPSETFRVLKNNEIRQFGEYRTQRLVLAAWDKLQSGEWH